jgi:putative hydrolase of the HAD superfamily
MPKARAVLFDADGVIVKAPRIFSQIYSEEIGRRPEDFLPFFKGDFRLALEGKADLKVLIDRHKDLWQWNEDTSILLKKWFDSENLSDPELLMLIKKHRKNGLKVYLATDQEKYRAEYFNKVMFPSVFDQILASSSLGYRKEDPNYWQAALRIIRRDIPGINPGEILYFDDGPHNIDIAKSAGINALLYVDAKQASETIESLTSTLG